MNKKTKKLLLGKETIRELSEEHLVVIVAASSVKPPVYTGPGIVITRPCSTSSE